jgi:hypothetical protein
MKRIFFVFFLFALAINGYVVSFVLIGSIPINVFATNSFDQSLQETQQALQNSINRQVQQSITDTISSIDDSSNSSSSDAKQIKSQGIPVNSSVNDIIRGGITSLQTDPMNNETVWILGGVYEIENLTSGSPTFNASFYMVKTNGSSSHSHDIYNSKLRIVTDSPMGNNSTFLNGTSTVTMREGPVTNVPINITLLGDNALNVWLDAGKLKKHFGTTPIFGTQELKCIEVTDLCK